MKSKTHSELRLDSAELNRIIESKKKELKTAEISMKAQFNGADPTIEAIVKRIEIRHMVAEIKELEAYLKKILKELAKS